MENDLLMKVVLCGDAKVGKSSLMKAFVEGKRVDVSEMYVPTIGVEFATKHLQHEGRGVKLVLWDSAGQERFRSITRSYFRGSSGVVIVFSVADRSSFEKVGEWVNEVRALVSPECSLMLVGNACDSASRVVEFAEAKKLAIDLGMTGQYFETSATENRGVSEAFASLVATIARESFTRAPAVAAAAEPAQSSAETGHVKSIVSEVEAADAEFQRSLTEFASAKAAFDSALQKLQGAEQRRAEAFSKLMPILKLP